MSEQSNPIDKDAADAVHALDAMNLNDYASMIHEIHEKWWECPVSGASWVTPCLSEDPAISRAQATVCWRMTKLALMNTEICEAMEGCRKDINDDKLTHRKMEEVELADTLIRIFDYCGAMGYDIEGAVQEKLEYNKQRADHKVENRQKEGGKAV